MPREAALFEAVDGRVLDAYLVLEPGKTVGPLWIQNAHTGRKKLEKQLGKLMKSNKLDAIKLLREWETRYRKECFYRGLRALLELQWNGKTKY